jgi:lantibiotic modifying enzyme
VLVRRQDAATGGWTTLPARAPLTGLTHGAAGIALALAEAGVALDQPAYLDAALRGLAYEAGTFDEAEGNWPDLRESAAGGFMLGWCAGAPGIALTRLRLLEILPDADQAATWRDELAAAGRATAEAPLLSRDHLCCGNLGRVVVLRTLAAREPDAGWDAAANGIVGGVLARSAGGLPRTVLGDGPDPIVLPGLMTGLSGIGLALADDDPADWVLRLLL